MESYVPDIYQKNIYEINYKKLKEKGIKCILFDLDNTLIKPVAFAKDLKEISEDTIKLFSKLKKMGFKVIVFSNGFPGKTKKFGILSDTEVRYRMKKPSIKGFEEIMETYRYKQNELIIIGDQIITDIKGGNDAGITTALIKPICKHDSIFTKVNRLKEKKVMKKLSKQDVFRVGKYYE